LWVIETINSGSISSRYKVTVGIHGDLDTVVTKLFLDVSEGLAILNQETGVRVPEISRMRSYRKAKGEAKKCCPFLLVP
jgi:hypothetical protein